MPAIPANLTVSQGLQELALSWEAVVDADSYILYVSLSQDVTDADTSIAVAGISYLHTGLDTLQYRYYRVAAIEGIEESDLSNEVNEIPRFPVEDPFEAPAGTRYPTRTITNVREIAERLDPTRHDPTIEYDFGNGRFFKRTRTDYG